jgi:hypothetical protein
MVIRAAASVKIQLSDLTGSVRRYQVLRMLGAQAAVHQAIRQP